jgi:3-oxoacyl-[acyl-carrier-protein] synthase II
MLETISLPKPKFHIGLNKRIDMRKKRVVITGIGVVSALGIGRDEFWQSLLFGKSGVKEIEQFSTVGLPSHKAAWVGNFDTGIPPMLLRRLDRPTRMVTKATALALEDSNLNINSVIPDVIDENLTEEIGLILNTTFGPVSTNEKYICSMIEQGPAGASPSLFTGTVTNGPAGYASMMFKLRGMSSVIVGASSVSYAFDLIRAGRADCILAGGFEEITETGYHVASELDFLSKSTPEAEENSRPYDTRRNGFILGEGCVIVVLESAGKAVARGANIYAEVAGHATLYDSSEDIRLSFRSLDTTILVSAMESALMDANCSPDEIDAIFGLAMSSPEVDIAEAKAFQRVFGNRLKTISVSAIKGALGETVGMANVAGIACGALAIKNSEIPPTINCEYLAPEIDPGYFHITQQSQQINIILSNSLELSGNDTVHILKRFIA